MEQPTPDRPSLWKRFRRILRRAVRVFLYAILLYVAILLIGLIPVNNGFEPTADGIEILFVSTAIHADVVLPIETPTINWRELFPAECFSGDTTGDTHVAIGWGDKGFYLHTPTWADLRALTAFKAILWPSACCVHVTYTRPEFRREGARSVKISVAQYERLVEHVKASLKQGADGSMVQIPDFAYGTNDAFFEAHGVYHCFNTCNCWAGSAMRSAGIRTGWFTPLPKTMFLYLPD